MTYHVDIVTSPPGCSVTANGKFLGLSDLPGLIWPGGTYHLEFAQANFRTLNASLELTEDVRLFKRVLGKGTRHQFEDLIPCGAEPKQVIFSPRGDRLIIPLLGGTGIDVIDLNTRQTRTVALDPYAHENGFVEVLFNSTGDRLFVSQMTTGRVHCLTYPGLVIKKSISTQGKWSKFMALSPDGKLLAVSNWESHDLSLIDPGNLTFIRTVPSTGKVPRGLAFTPDGRYLYVACFDSGEIIKLSTRTWEPVKRIRTGGAMRHLVIDHAGKYLYADNMHFDRIYKIAVANDRVVGRLQVGQKPNTIELTPDDRFLYVSCRGPNNPKGYLLRSLEPGEIYVLRTDPLKVDEVIPGGTQPTGLALSADGRRMAFTNFQDNTIELYNRLVDPPDP